MALKFFWNGIKDTSAKMQRCSYTDGKLLHHPEGTITIYGTDLHGFSNAVRAAFTVENNTDLLTDYFEDDHIRVLPDHPLYSQVKAAMLARQARYAGKVVR